MNYYFQNYRFDSATRSLYQEDTFTSLRVGDAKLLAIFLQNPKKVLSKEEIINLVWGHDVVSEQAIFQGVSQLRNRFGSGAIKTFPRKGYMWMFEIESRIDFDEKNSTGKGNQSLVDDESPSVSVSQSFTRDSSISAAGLFSSFGEKRYKRRSAAVFAIAIAGIVFSLFYVVSDEEISSPPKKTIFAVLPITFGGVSIQEDSRTDTTIISDMAKALEHARLKHRSMEFVYPQSSLALNDLDATPHRHYKEVTVNSGADVILGVTIEVKHNAYIGHFRVLGRKGGWTGRLQAATIDGLAGQLVANVAVLSTAPLLLDETDDAHLMTARVRMLHEEYPGNLVVLHRLSKDLELSGDFNSAIIYAEKMQQVAQQEGDPFYLAMAKMNHANSLIELGFFAEAKSYVVEARRGFASANEVLFEAEAWTVEAGLHDIDNDYKTSKYAMSEALSLVRSMRFPLREIHLLTQAAAFSYNQNKFDEKDAYLRLAESLLIKHSISRAQYSVLYYHMASLTDDENEAEEFYRKTLDVLDDSQDWWEKDSALYDLTQLLVRQKRWAEAIEILDDHANESESKSSMLAYIYYSKGDFQQAEAFALDAFRLASMSGEKNIMLNSARVLSRVVKGYEDRQIYSDYLQSNAGDSYQKRSGKNMLKPAYLRRKWQPYF